MKVNQVSRWKGSLTRIKKHDVKSVFLCTLTSCTKSLITKRCILSKSQTALHHRLPNLISEYQRPAEHEDVIFDLLESCRCSPAGDIIVGIQSLGNVDILSSRCSLVVDGWSEPDGKERERAAVRSVRSHGCSALGSVATTLKLQRWRISM